MELKLEIYPGVEVKRREFVKQFGPYSIAIDGFCTTPPWLDAARAIMCLNHHHGSPRLETLATCQQAAEHARLKTFEVFRDGHGTLKIRVVGNDADEDICLTYSVIKRIVMSRNMHNPLWNMLLFVAGRMDTTGGSYPIDPDADILEIIAWIMEPYRTFRMQGGIERAISSEFIQVIEAVDLRVGEYLLGRSGRVKMDTRHRIMSGDLSFAVVEEIGPHARIGLFSKGVQAFLVPYTMSNGRHKYTFGRQGPGVDIDLVGLARLLNKYEKPEQGQWGGGDSFCASPRVVGSRLAPDEVIEIRNEFEAKRFERRNRIRETLLAA